jgi:ABC-type bacteriocin/lantibiotic exporter with double-glycine peptidase domain
MSSENSGREFMVVRQRRGNDCGPAALATVTAAHGRAFDYPDLVDDAALDRQGTDLLSLARMAGRRGFSARAVKAGYCAIADCPLPAIAQFRRPLGGRHFVVLLGWSVDSVTIADPAVGLVRLSRAAFRRRSTGYFLLVEPTATMPSAGPGGAQS